MVTRSLYNTARNIVPTLRYAKLQVQQVISRSRESSRNFNRVANAISLSYRAPINKVMQSVLEVELGGRFECL